MIPNKPCATCSLPHRSSHTTCPRCRILARADWFQPSELACELLDQIDAIVDDNDWRSQNIEQLLTWLKDAYRREQRLGLSDPK
jgi:hypothetical protein